MNQDWNRNVKIVVSIAVSIASLLVGFYIHIPITQVDAFVSDLTNTRSVYSEEIIAPAQSIAFSENPIDTEILPTLVDLPDQYYTKPKPVEIQQTAATTNVAASQNQPVVQSLVSATVQSSVSIPKIGLNNVLYNSGQMTNIADIDNKLLYGPVIDTNYAVDACQPNAHTYLMGHSEPAFSWQSSYPGSYIFSRLHTLVPGDIISMTNSNGASCNYQVTGWETVTTDENDTVPWSVFNNLLYPDTSDSSILTIQTCQQGSATVRLILRAKMV